MARIVNVIHRPHLVTYRGYETSDYRCCAVCDYKVFVETDEGNLLVASVISEEELQEFDIEEAIRKVKKKDQDEDWYYPVVMAIGVKDFDSFVNGGIETGLDAFDSFYGVVNDLGESEHLISDDLRKRLVKLVDGINRLLKKKE